MASLGQMKGVYDGTKVGAPGEEVKVGKITGMIGKFLTKQESVLTTLGTNTLLFAWM